MITLVRFSTAQTWVGPRFLMIGKTVSHYRIIERLGEGGMGIVYLAEDTVLGRKVAIKTLTEPNGVGHQHFRTRFLREARAVSTLSHPHIATIHDYGETEDGEPYIVMEFIRGEMLADLMLKESLTIPRALQIVSEVAEALGEAHHHGIIHRDIKPSNVAINHRGEVKVLDFGLAKQLDTGLPGSVDPDRQTLLNTQTREGVIVGTPMYLSPEQALGVEVDARSDLFSLGAVLYECLAGKPPFLGGGPMEICAKVIRDDPTAPSQINADVPRELDRIVLKALAKKADDRYQTAAELITDLENVSAEVRGFHQAITRTIAVAPGTHPTGALATLSDIFKRPRLSLGYVFAGIVLVAILAAVLWKVTRPTVHQPSEPVQALYSRGVDAIREGAFFRASKILQQVVQQDPSFPLAHARLAETWMELDSSDKAMYELIIAKDLVRDTSLLPRVDGLRLDAVTHTAKREFGKAVEDYKNLVETVPGDERAYALVDLGRAYEKNEQPDKAIETYQEATKLDQPAAGFLRLGVMLGRRAKYGDAYSALNNAYKLFDDDTEIEGLTEVLLQRAVVLGLEGKFSEARTQLAQALEKAAALENKDKRIKVLLNLSNTEIQAGNPDKAREYSSQAVDLARANGLDNLTMQGIIDIGNSFIDRGNFTEAERNFNEALRLAELYKGKRSEARALLSLSSLRSQQGNAEGAREYFHRALPFYEQGGYQKEISQAYAILGRVQKSVGDYSSAQQTFEQQLKVARQIGDPQSIALALEGLGGVLSDLQNFPAALRYYDESYKLASNDESKVVMGFTANSRASLLWQLGNYDRAHEALTEALEIAQPPGTQPYAQLLALVYLTRSRLALSQLDFKTALADGKKSLDQSATRFKSIEVRAGFTVGLAEVKSGQTAEGRKHCEAALMLARDLPNHSLLSHTLLAFAEAMLLAGDSDAALSHAVEAQKRLTAAKQVEAEWRAWLIQARATEGTGDKLRARQLASQADTVLRGLEQQWGTAEYQTYLQRKDIKALRESLIALIGGS